MSRLARISPFSGQAAGFDVARSNPLELVSRDLYLGPDGKPIEGLDRWAMPEKKTEGVKGDVFQRHWKADPLVVIGGFEFLKEIGAIATWLTNDQTRKEAALLIEQRGWVDLLGKLGVQGKEASPTDLFGKAAINDFLKHSPDVRRDASIRSRVALSPSQRATHLVDSRRKHCLRLRKAVEFVTLIEAALRYRYSTDRTKNRTHRYTAIDPEDVYPEVVWDVLWFEPINYTLSFLPNAENFPYVLENEAVVQDFVDRSGQRPETLWWMMKGLPGKHRTVSAAADACHAALGNAKPIVTTVDPSEYRKRMKLLTQKTKRETKLGVETIVEPGPGLAVTPSP